MPVSNIACALIAVILIAVPSHSPAQPGAKPEGLVSCWPGEVDGRDTAGTNHGTLHGGVRVAPGKIGNGFEFDGTSGYVLIPHSSSLSFSNELTIELWYKPVQTNAEYYILIDKREPVFESVANYGICYTPAGLGVYYNDTAVSDGDDTPFAGTFEVLRYPHIPALGQFHHMAVTYEQVQDSQVKLEMYLNGQLVRQRLIAGNLSKAINSVPVAIGAISGGLGEFFKGTIDEVAIYRRALTGAEIRNEAAK